MTPLIVAQMILAIALIASILLQQRGTGLGGAFGGEVTAYRSRRGIERTLFRLTTNNEALAVGGTHRRRRTRRAERWCSRAAS